MTARPLSIPDAACALRAGGVIAYPTEAVWGLGCDPFDAAALARLLALKQRPAAKGMIVIAARPAQVDRYLRWSALAPERRDQVLASWPGPNTWLIPCTDAVPHGLRGDHDTLAVRITAHPVAAALCEAFGGPIVSTSANRAGEPPARRIGDLAGDLR
ncbi:MAG TPA: Sua5/YciO/YrdC/YwlC family protein, partial [Chiayiivirga sp.]|nr:Sua5/YciO/YrdC/YwlC family protein [Chiayiivirga sp.]